MTRPSCTTSSGGPGELHPNADGPWYLFLDEVTSVPQWQKGIKTAWDQGLTRGDSLLLTGSSAHDLKIGVERLPGRRGNGSDYLHLPMSFRDFCTQVEGIHLPEETTSVEGYLDPRGRTLARRLYLLSSELDRAFRTYLQVGGYPAAVRDYRAGGTPRATAETLRMLWSTIAGDIAKSGRNQTAAAKLLEEIAVSLGNPLKWSGAARAMGMASNHTAREYVEFLSASFALLTVYFWDMSGGTLQPSTQRKVYYVDPLLGEIAPSVIPGAPRPRRDGLVENAVATGLFRSAAHVLIQADAVPGAVGHWRSSNNRELGFLVPAEEFGRGGRVPVLLAGLSETPQRRVAIG